MENDVWKVLEDLRAHYGKPGWEWLSVDYLNGFEAAAILILEEEVSDGE